MGNKKCSKCGEYVPLSGFYKNKRTKDGRASQCKECAGETVRKYNMKKLYDLDDWSYGVLLENQEYRCQICGTHVDDLETALSVDHDHETGYIRGLLCSNCNVGIGNLADSPEYLRKAAVYLENAQNTP